MQTLQMCQSNSSKMISFTLLIDCTNFESLLLILRLIGNQLIPEMTILQIDKVSFSQQSPGGHDMTLLKAKYFLVFPPPVAVSEAYLAYFQPQTF